MLQHAVDQFVALGDQPHIEVEEKRDVGEMRQGRKLGKRPARHHLLKRHQLARGRSLVKQIERRVVTDTVMAPHQAFIAKHRTGADLDDWLEGIFDDKLGKCEQLVIGEATQDARVHRGARNHDLSPKFTCFYGAKA